MYPQVLNIQNKKKVKKQLFELGGQIEVNIDDFCDNEALHTSIVIFDN